MFMVCHKNVGCMLKELNKKKGQRSALISWTLLGAALITWCIWGFLSPTLRVFFTWENRRCHVWETSMCPKPMCLDIHRCNFFYFSLYWNRQTDPADWFEKKKWRNDQTTIKVKYSSRQSSPHISPRITLARPSHEITYQAVHSPQLVA